MDIINQIVTALGGWDVVIKLVVAVIGAILGVPLITKNPSSLPLIGGLYKSDDDKAIAAARVLDALRKKRGVPDDERRRKLTEALSEVLQPSEPEPKK